MNWQRARSPRARPTRAAPMLYRGCRRFSDLPAMSAPVGQAERRRRREGGIIITPVIRRTRDASDHSERTDRGRVPRLLEFLKSRSLAEEIVGGLAVAALVGLVGFGIRVATEDGTDEPSRASTPSVDAVTLKLDQVPLDQDISLMGVVNRPPDEDRTYWLLVQVRDPNSDHAEYYPRRRLESATGEFHITLRFPANADLGIPRTAQVWSVSRQVASVLQEKLDSPPENTDPLTSPPCTGCEASAAVEVTPRS